MNNKLKPLVNDYFVCKKIVREKTSTGLVIANNKDFDSSLAKVFYSPNTPTDYYYMDGSYIIYFQGVDSFPTVTIDDQIYDLIPTKNVVGYLKEHNVSSDYTWSIRDFNLFHNGSVLVSANNPKTKSNGLIHKQKLDPMDRPTSGTVLDVLVDVGDDYKLIIKEKEVYFSNVSGLDLLQDETHWYIVLRYTDILLYSNP